MKPLLTALPTLLLAATFAATGCHAQNPPAGSQLSPETARRVEVLLRQKASLPPGSTIVVGPRVKGSLPGFDEISVAFTSVEGNTSHPITFLISTDGKTLAQFNKYDISANPRDLVSAEGRPARGGPADAPVLIVGFDDLECPYCARLHANIFPAITERYKDQVRVVYKDFPLDQHPWAMRAAVDTNCLGAQSTPAYWTAVDYIHAHAGDIGSTPATDKAPGTKTLPKATEQLDTLTREQGTAQKLDLTKLNACIAKQDTAAIQESKTIASKLGVDSTPSLFINGDKIDGALPIEFLFKIIDNALIAEGRTPPPPYISPVPPPPPAAPSTK